MSLSRKEQSERASKLLPLVDAAIDKGTLESLYEEVKLLLASAGWDDNGIAFDLSEYTYERLQITIDETHSDVWAVEARKSLVEQLL